MRRQYRLATDMKRSPSHRWKGIFSVTWWLLPWFNLPRLRIVLVCITRRLNRVTESPRQCPRQPYSLSTFSRHDLR